jgi:hypothetical protein
LPQAGLVIRGGMRLRSAKMKNFLRKLRGKLLSPVLTTLEGPLLGSVQIQQRALEGRYRDLVRTKQPLPSFAEAEFRVYSQSGEDGIIALIMAAIGCDSRKFLEIGVQTGAECNSANLAKNCSWDGWLVEGDAGMAQLAREHFAHHPCSWVRDVRVITAFVTRENINALIESNGIPENLDLLSIDIDGNDLWVWQEIKGIRPRLVIVEYNASFGPDRSVSVPYQSDFVRDGAYHGASLRALVKVGRQKGYRFVGCNTTGINAFFVRTDLGAECLPEVSVEAGYRPNTLRDRRGESAGLLRELAKRELVEI